jgi:hypothetical protein
VLAWYKDSGRRVVRVEADNDPPREVFEKICRAMESNDRS